MNLGYYGLHAGARTKNQGYQETRLTMSARFDTLAVSLYPGSDR
jgi:hypothetical protein